jgi:hypothetical protein
MPVFTSSGRTVTPRFDEQPLFFGIMALLFALWLLVAVAIGTGLDGYRLSVIFEAPALMPLHWTLPLP